MANPQFDERIEWMMSRVRAHFKGASYEGVTLSSPEMVELTTFLDGDALRALWFSEARGQLSVTSKAPALNKKSGSGFLYFLKILAGAVDPEKPMGAQVLFGDLPPGLGALDHLARVAAEVYLPVVTNPRQREAWPELVAKDVVDGAQGFVSNLQIVLGQVPRSTLPHLDNNQISILKQQINNL